MPHRFPARTACLREVNQEVMIIVPPVSVGAHTAVPENFGCSWCPLL